MFNIFTKFQELETFIIPTIRPMRMIVRMTSMQNLWGFLNFSMTPFSFLLDFTKSSFKF